MHPTLKANSETRFPHQHPLGNGIPFWTSIPGCAFRFDVRGKLRPGIPAQTGMTFPDGAGFGKRVPLWGGTFRDGLSAWGVHLETASRSGD